MPGRGLSSLDSTVCFQNLPHSQWREQRSCFDCCFHLDDFPVNIVYRSQITAERNVPRRRQDKYFPKNSQKHLHYVEFVFVLWSLRICMRALIVCFKHPSTARYINLLCTFYPVAVQCSSTSVIIFPWRRGGANTLIKHVDASFPTRSISI